MVEDGICPICRYPKKTGSSGRLTQWIIACNCDNRLVGEEDPTQGVSIKICRDCGKRIGEGRPGSFTQFVFRFDICQCAEPKPVSTALESIAQPINEYYVEDGEEELATEPGSFPQERYKALSPLGSGSGGAVFLARDRLLNKLVAVKVLHWLEPKQIAAFQEEARVTNKVRHPSIVSLLDFGVTESGVPYMVLEHIAGSSLEELVIQNGPLNWQTCRLAFRQICDALEHAHNHGVLHRDIKPGNIILEIHDDTFRVRLIDFGIAAMQHEGESPANSARMAGAPLFMSPDAGLGRSYDLRSETYSLGCSLFYALSGRPPFEGETSMQTIMLHAQEAPPKLSEFTDADKIEFPLGLDELITKALSKDPDDRFQTVSEFRQALNSITLPEREVQAPVDVVQEAAQAEIKKKRLIDKRLAIAGSLLLLSGIAIVVGISAFSRIPIKPTEPAVDPEDLESRVLETKADKALESIESQKWHLDSYGDDAIKILGKRKKSVESNANVYKGSEVTDEDFKDLAGKRPLTGVEISPMSTATGIGFRYLKDVPLEVADIFAPNFNDEGARELSKIKTIDRLCIRYTSKLTGKGLAYIAEMPKVTTLQLRNIDNLPPDAVRILSRAKSIRQLDLGFSKPIAVEDFSFISKFPALKVLALSETEIGNEHLAMICKCGVREMEVEKTKITPKGLAILEKCRTLKGVRISPGNGITMSALKDLQKKRPDMVVKIVDPIDVLDVVKDFAL